MDQLVWNQNFYKTARQSIHFVQKTPATLIRNIFYREVGPQVEFFRPELRAINHNYDQKGDREIILSRNDTYDEVGTEYIEDIVTFLKFYIKDREGFLFYNQFCEFVTSHALELDPRHPNVIGSDEHGFLHFINFLDSQIHYMRRLHLNEYTDYRKIRRGLFRQLMMIKDKQHQSPFVLKQFVDYGADPDDPDKYKHCKRGYILTHNSDHTMKQYCFDTIMQILEIKNNNPVRMYSYGNIYRYDNDKTGKYITAEKFHYEVGYGKRLVVFFDRDHRPNATHEFHVDNNLFLPIGFSNETPGGELLPIFLDSNLSGVWLEFLRRDLQSVHSIAYLESGQIMFKRPTDLERWLILDFNDFIASGGHLNGRVRSLREDNFEPTGNAFWNKPILKYVAGKGIAFAPIQPHMIVECPVISAKFNKWADVYDEEYMRTAILEEVPRTGDLRGFLNFSKTLFRKFEPLTGAQLSSMSAFPSLSETITKRIAFPQHYPTSSLGSSIRNGPSSYSLGSGHLVDPSHEHWQQVFDAHYPI